MATLLAIRGPLTGARLDLEGEEVRAGRSNQCGICLPDSTVSRVHALFRRHRRGWALEDCASSAGTYHNNRPVREPVVLTPNDEIRIGHSIFLYDSDFDVQNADFTDNSVYFSSPHDDTVEENPVTTLEGDTVVQGDDVTREGLDFLTDLGELFETSGVPFGEALSRGARRLAKMLAADVVLLLLFDHATNQLRVVAAVAPGNVLADRGMLNRVYREAKGLLLSGPSALGQHPAPGAPTPASERSVVAAPLLAGDSCLGVLWFERHELDAYTLKDLRLAQSLGRLMGVFIEGRQRAEAVMLRENWQASDSLVVGESPAFRGVLELARRVAPTNSVVLLTGETGTGKELLAREIHRVWEEARTSGPFIPVNCAAIPENLFESELFGHERGAFTGAVKMRQGLVEVARGGTLFLDEIGELGVSLQPKILRFLQDGTFMRVGGSKVHRAHVRVIAATNRDLEEEVRRGRFRDDLYHRLAVVPLVVPPLRERREDIRTLAEYYCHVFAKRLHRDVIGISEEAMIQLEKYSWPGNVRELANCLERAVLLSDDKILLPRHFFLQYAGTVAQRPREKQRRREDDSGSTLVLRKLEDVEREYILKVMKEVGNSQVKAAELLGIHRNTLRKKLHDWGVL